MSNILELTAEHSVSTLIKNVFVYSNDKAAVEFTNGCPLVDPYWILVKYFSKPILPTEFIIKKYPYKYLGSVLIDIRRVTGIANDAFQKLNWKIL